MEEISVVISVVEEELFDLPHALSSVKELASEIVIVDMTDSNELTQIAREFRAKVYKHKRVSYVEKVRNFGLSKVKNNWVLIMDPDEEVSKSLSDKLTSIIKDKNSARCSSFPLPSKDLAASSTTTRRLSARNGSARAADRMSFKSVDFPSRRVVFISAMSGSPRPL